MAILDYSAGLNNAPNAVANTLNSMGQMQGLQAQRQQMQAFEQQQQAAQAQQQQVAQAQQQEQAARQKGAELLQNGSPKEISRFMLQNPSVAKDFINAADFQDDAALGSRVDYAKSVISGSTPARQAIENQIALVESRGGNPQGLIKTLAMGSDEAIVEAARKDLAMLDPKSMINYEEAMGYGQDDLMATFPSSVQETMWFNKQTPEVKGIHMKLKRDEKPSLDEKLTYEESKADIKTQASIEESKGKTDAQRIQGYIDSGVDSADNLITVNRSLKLLDDIKTGGIDKVMLDAKRLFGIESANEAELSYNLGKTVLAQLKPIFGSAFTEKEGERLEKLESSLRKSGEGNIRILNSIQKSIDRATRRGLRAAESQNNEFAANEIRLALEEAESFSYKKPKTTQSQVKRTPQEQGIINQLLEAGVTQEEINQRMGW